jgi:hypothetical protein
MPFNIKIYIQSVYIYSTSVIKNSEIQESLWLAAETQTNF